MGAKIRQVLLFLFVLPTMVVQGQVSKLSTDNQRLYLKLAFNYYTVVKEGRVDQDSSLLLVSIKNHVSRWPVISEGFGSALSENNNKWIDTRQTGVAKARLATLKGIDRLQLLVLLGAYYAFQPGYHQTDRDSARLFLSEAKKESVLRHADFWLNQSLILLGKNFFKENKVTAGNECFEKVINSCQKSHDYEMAAKAWDYQGSYVPPVAETFAQKIKSVANANLNYKLTGQTASQINTLMNLAYLKFVVNDSKGGEADALAALRLELSLKFPYLHYTYDILSLYKALRESEHKNLEYEFNAVRSALATKDSLGLAYFYIRLSKIKTGRKLAGDPYMIYWVRKSVDEFRKNRDPDIYFSLFSLTDILVESGRSGEAATLLKQTMKAIPPVNDRVKMLAYMSLAASFEALKNFKTAERYYILADELQQHDKLITKEFRNSMVKYRMGQFYFEVKNYSKAEKYLKAAMNNSGPMDDELSILSGSHMLLYKIDSLRSNYKSAAEHLQQYIGINNKYVKANDVKSVAGLKLQFMMAQKVKDLQILQARSDFQLQQAATTRKFIYIGIAAFSLIIILLYSRYYKNRRQQREMDKKNAELLKVINEKNDLIISKEWLLKEVHHRVKNNLHTVICLLESQAGYLQNDALKAIENSQHRIYAMSLIHQKLYQSEDVKTVNMEAYLPEFVAYLKDSFETGMRIRFELDIDAIKLDVSYAVPLSLVINEAVTNAIKYAFPNDNRGTIFIFLKKAGEEITLTIADNGVGIDEGSLQLKSASLGLNLLLGLSEDIKAETVIENKNGTCITVAFKVEELLFAPI